MAKFSEDTFNTWRKPPSNNEEAKLANAQKLVNDVIRKDNFLSTLSIEVFGQGSYANDTNVRLNSDVDVNVMYRGEEYFDLPEGKTREDFGIQLSNKITYVDYKTAIENALVKEFGRASVVRKNKCIQIIATPTRGQCDVVPTFQYRRYENEKISVVGTRFFSDQNEIISSFPKQHIQNGIEKNKLTARKFKRTTRIFRKLRYRMIDEGVVFPDSISSFLLESLTWNLPNDIYNQNERWTDIIKESIIYLYNNTKVKEACNEWGEVSELLYLFRPSRKWTHEDVNKYLQILWEYLEF